MSFKELWGKVWLASCPPMTHILLLKFKYCGFRRGGKEAAPTASVHWKDDPGPQRVQGTEVIVEVGVFEKRGVWVKVAVGVLVGIGVKVGPGVVESQPKIKSLLQPESVVKSWLPAMKTPLAGFMVLAAGAFPPELE